MNWKECGQLNEFMGISRFEWPAGDGKSGFDCSDAFTFNDVWGGICWLWTWPGDYLLNLPDVKNFFELGPETVVGSGWSIALGWFVFLALVTKLGG